MTLTTFFKLYVLAESILHFTCDITIKIPLSSKVSLHLSQTETESLRSAALQLHEPSQLLPEMG